MTSSFDSIRRALNPRLDRLHAKMVEALSSDNPLMCRVIGHYLERRGKELRPILAMLTADLLGGEELYDVTGPAAAIEILHNASLIHDDVIDNSAVRHGADTINALWDNHIAVLVGDFFVSRALRLAASTEDLKVINTLAGLGSFLSLGEMDQLNNAREHTLTEEGYFGVISLKTASLFTACVEVGAYSVGVTDERLDKLRRYALIFGQCFQITDDIFDYFPSEKLGKPTGNDLREGKVTLPLLAALNSGDSRASEMHELLEHESLTDGEIGRLIDFAITAGGVDYARTTLKRLRDEAAEIARSLAPCLEENPLVHLIDFIIARDK
ncbi:MAG: polyprenyl synthetase family protein [Muribaculaceae bacterium]|nr:polyprenyl synthetase family protein [Muribaculaceae bacterium]